MPNKRKNRKKKQKPAGTNTDRMEEDDDLDYLEPASASQPSSKAQRREQAAARVLLGERHALEGCRDHWREVQQNLKKETLADFSGGQSESKLAAYVAEGSISASEGERLFQAGEPLDGKSRAKASTGGTVRVGVFKVDEDLDLEDFCSQKA